jgi:hypothetical protein
VYIIFLIASKPFPLQYDNKKHYFAPNNQPMRPTHQTLLTRPTYQNINVPNKPMLRQVPQTYHLANEIKDIQRDNMAIRDNIARLNTACTNTNKEIRNIGNLLSDVLKKFQTIPQATNHMHPPHYPNQPTRPKFPNITQAPIKTTVIPRQTANVNQRQPKKQIIPLMQTNPTIPNTSGVKNTRNIIPKTIPDHLFEAFKTLRKYANNRHTFRITEEDLKNNTKNIDHLCNPIYGQILANDKSANANKTKTQIQQLIKKSVALSNDFYLAHFINLDFTLINDFKNQFNPDNGNELANFNKEATELITKNIRKRRCGRYHVKHIHRDMENILGNEPNYIGEHNLISGLRIGENITTSNSPPKDLLADSVQSSTHNFPGYTSLGFFCLFR